MIKVLIKKVSKKIITSRIKIERMINVKVDMITISVGYIRDLIVSKLHIKLGGLFYFWCLYSKGLLILLMLILKNTSDDHVACKTSRNRFCQKI